jgi:hypothetical protein
MQVYAVGIQEEGLIQEMVFAKLEDAQEAAEKYAAEYAEANDEEILDKIFIHTINVK